MLLEARALNRHFHCQKSSFFRNWLTYIRLALQQKSQLPHEPIRAQHRNHLKSRWRYNSHEVLTYLWWHRSSPSLKSPQIFCCDVPFHWIWWEKMGRIAAQWLLGFGSQVIALSCHVVYKLWTIFKQSVPSEVGLMEFNGNIGNGFCIFTDLIPWEMRHLQILKIESLCEPVAL